MRKAAEARGDAFKYDRRCARLAPDEAARRVAAGRPFAVRFRMPEGETSWTDLVHGPIKFANKDIGEGDFIILRSDGTPIYNLAVVSDDIAMDITLVMRGDDHISNTPKQIALYRALQHEPPVFAHVPMILGSDGKKLSKRHGATGVDEFRKAGYLPDALLNFLALLGWAPDGETTIMSRDELVERFQLDRVTSSPAQFDYDKLDWMNGVYLRALSLDDYVHALLLYLGEQGYDWDAELVRKTAPIVQEKIALLGEYPAFAGFFFEEVSPSSDELAGGAPMLQAARAALAELEPFTAEAIEAALRAAADELGLKPRQAFQPIRIAVTGSKISPGLFESIELLGREKTLARLSRAVAS
jgi:glutamyl-tRNA synthetase